MRRRRRRGEAGRGDLVGVRSERRGDLAGDRGKREMRARGRGLTGGRGLTRRRRRAGGGAWRYRRRRR